MPLTRFKLSSIVDDGITSAKIKDGDVATVDIADQAVTLAKLEHGTSSNDGKFLRANNGADPSYEVVAVTPTAVSDQANTSTGSFDFPSGTTAQRPTGSALFAGSQRFNTELGVFEFYDGTVWKKVSSIVATLNTVTGTIFAGLGTTLTLAGDGFLSSGLIVNFVQADDSIDVNVTVTPSSDTAATVAVPSSVYSNVTAGRVVIVKVTNSDGSSSLGVNKTAGALPSGGSITTSGNYRIHTFNSSANFTNTKAGLATEYLIVSGGGGGGANGGSNGNGGGGGGGLRAGSTTLSSVQNYAVVVGAGGASTSGQSGQANGSNSSFNSIVTLGGGCGQSYGQSAGNGATGGGGTANGTSPGTGTGGQGYNGGSGSPNSRGGGGGGGSGAVGGNATTSNHPAGKAGDGGAGGTSSITGSSVAYGGGGGGSMADQNDASKIGAGGTGGGGSGSCEGGNPASTAGAANLGGGGGSGRGTSGSAGGSGVVIIRYDQTTL